MRLIDLDKIKPMDFPSVEMDGLDVVRYLNTLPTVDTVEVVHGEWLDGCAIHNGKEVYQSIDCSVCEEVFKIESHDREYWKGRFKRCFCCGAKMDGGNEDA